MGTYEIEEKTTYDLDTNEAGENTTYDLDTYEIGEEKKQHMIWTLMKYEKIETMS